MHLDPDRPSGAFPFAVPSAPLHLTGAQCAASVHSAASVSHASVSVSHPALLLFIQSRSSVEEGGWAMSFREMKGVGWRCLSFHSPSTGGAHSFRRLLACLPHRGGQHPCIQVLAICYLFQRERNKKLPFATCLQMKRGESSEL